MYCYVCVHSINIFLYFYKFIYEYFYLHFNIYIFIYILPPSLSFYFQLVQKHMVGRQKIHSGPQTPQNSTKIHVEEKLGGSKGPRF